MVYHYLICMVIAFLVINILTAIVAPDYTDPDYGKVTMAIVAWPLALIAALSYVMVASLQLIFGKN